MAKRSKVLKGEVPRWLNAMLVFGTLATVVLLELQRPLRRNTQNKLERDARNATVSLLAAATVALAEKPAVAPLALKVHNKGLGLLKMVRLPAALEVFLSVLLLDYTLYIWHYLTHKVPLLWRFHLAHHVDLDMDATTALRFHPGELLLSVPWRAAQVRLLGISPLSLAVWQTVTLMEIMFHHSNVRLPYGLESRLCKVIVTPRMHGIHHSVVGTETDSNWSTIFSWPDFVHGTIRLNIPQQGLTVGVAGYGDPSQLTLKKILELPFVSRLPQVEGRRQPMSIPPTTLAG